MYLVIIGTFLAGILLLMLQKLRNKRLSAVGKCVFITGCDSGVGLSLALHAESLGFHVIATCLNDSGEGANMLKQKASIYVLKMDVTKPGDIDQVKTLVEKLLLEKSLSLWTVINNAGVLVFGNFDWQLETQILQQINVNLIGVILTVRAFLPLIRSSKGRIINITSANGQFCLPGLSIYCASKHAVEGFTNSLRQELKPWNVRVILVNPGDLPKNTKILSQQSIHAQLMKEAISPADWKVYGDYFDCFQGHFQNNFPATAVPALINDEGLNSILEECLLEEDPRNFYTNLSVAFRCFTSLLKLIPTRFSDGLILKMWGDSIGWNWSKMERYK